MVQSVGVVEVAQVLVLALGGPGRIGVGQVVVRARRGCVSNGPGVHMLANDQRKNSRRRRDDDRRRPRAARRSAGARGTSAAPRAAPRGGDRAGPGAGCFVLRLRQASIGSPPFSRAGDACGTPPACAGARARRSPAGGRRGSVMPSSSRSFCSNARGRGGTRPLRLRREVGLEVLDVAADRRATASVDASARSPSRCRSSTRANARGRSSSMNVSAPRQRLEADLDEDAGRILDVVAGGLDQARHLPQLREHAAGALGFRRVGRRAPGAARLDARMSA